MPVINAMEMIVQDLFIDFQSNYKLKCDCEKCKRDILALTLNRLQPRYVSSQNGEVHIKTLYMDQQLQLDVIRELTKAKEIVETNPRHPYPPSTLM